MRGGGLVIFLLVTATSMFAADIKTGEEAVAAYAKAWKVNRELLPAVQAELKVSIKNYDLKVSEVKTLSLSKGKTVTVRRDPESTYLFRVSRDQDRLRVTSITPTEEGDDFLKDLLVVGHVWKNIDRGALMLRRRDQVGGGHSVDPYDLQSPELRWDSPEELLHAANLPEIKDVSYEVIKDRQGQLTIQSKIENDIVTRVIDYDLVHGMMPVRYRRFQNNMISADEKLEYETVGTRGGRICVKHVWRLRPDGQDQVAGEPRAWYTEQTYELQKLRVLNPEEIEDIFDEKDFQADRVLDRRR